jgi:hypothetical protein
VSAWGDNVDKKDRATDGSDGGVHKWTGCGQDCGWGVPAESDNGDGCIGPELSPFERGYPHNGGTFPHRECYIATLV